MTGPLLGTLPWLFVALYAAVVIRRPRPLPVLEPPAEDRPTKAGHLPRVSVIVPARNEARSIEAFLGSLVDSTYPNFELIVVDDRSDDATGALARAADGGNAQRFVVLDGAALPEGWLGKPWACWQGFQEARGQILLFTDADTLHGPSLLGRAVAALEEDAVGMVTVVGRQILKTFWEKVIQPQILVLIGFRFPHMHRPVEGRCGRAIASGQFILVRRDVYEAVDGHRGIRGEVVEDLRLAQRICRSGRRLSIREATDSLAVRMYHSLREMVEGWSKNLAIGSAQSLPSALRRVAPPVMFLLGVGLWILPPLVFLASLASLAGIGGADLLLWSGSVCGISLLFWAAAAREMRIHPAWGLLYPLGSAVAAFIFARSWLRGPVVEWKGRTYRIDEGPG